ncbi:MAG: DUF2497 domain-containing protein [OCS116 cluster bacterium]|uniref:Pole-organizing protein PopZ n=1 Tax=OCS116 cluster bacterium TaxID=2030921 RepID=A0A2A4Z7J3_9PROT|nr:DUF2497 domain-containing protein [OCS116 cluster bacterium]
MSETELAENDSTDGGNEEPTMEEILSSIRRIISDDDEPVAEAAEADPELDDDDDDEEILELTEILAEEDPVDETNVDDLLSPDDIDDLEFAQPEPEPVEEELDMEMAMAMESEPESAAEPAPMVEEIAMDMPDLAISDSLISEQVGDAVNKNFHLLANTLLAQNGAGQTVESMVMALMRPMLKSWLDENLPVMVEKIVREEIERVARGGKM